jgi:hypothetical protein
MSIISQTKELLNKYKSTASSVGKTLLGSGLLGFNTSPGIIGVDTSKGFVNGQLQPKISSIPQLNEVNRNITNYIQNRYVQPVVDLPKNVQTMFNPRLDWKQRAGGALGTIGGVATLIPDPIQDIALPIYDYAKGARASYLRGGNLKQNVMAGIQSATLEKPVGLGSALSTNHTVENIGNIAEIPLMLGLTAKLGRGTNIGYDQGIVKRFGEIIQDPVARRAIQRFATEVERTGGKKNLGEIGRIVQNTLRDLFGENGANLTNKQAKNLFDILWKQSGDPGLFNIKKISPGLSTQNIREGIQPSKILSEVNAPGLTKEAGKTTKQMINQLPVSQPKLEVSPLGPEVVSPKKVSQGIIPQNLNPTEPYFNVERLNISSPQKATLAKVVEETKPQIESVVGKKLSNKEAVEFANVTSRVLNRAIPRAETLAWEAKVLNARKLLAEQAKNGTVTQDYIDNLVAIKSAGTDIARKLQSLGVNVDPSEITAKQAILESILKVVDDTDAILKKAKGVDFNNFEQAADFYRQFVKPTAGDWIDKIRYTSMLSSPQTHISNIVSNLQGTGLIEPIVKTIEGGVDFLRAAATGGERTRFAGEGAAYLQGYYSKLREAGQKFANIMKGKEFSSMSELYNLPLTKAGTVARKFENTQTFFPKLLQGMDEFFQVLTKGGLESSSKYRVAKGGKAVSEEAIAKEARKLLFNAEFGLKEEGPLLKALEYIPTKVMEARANANPVVSTIAKYTFPFVRVPSNILKASVEYSPAGIVTTIGAADKTRQLSKAILGTSIGLGTAMLAGSDRLSWSSPTDPTGRKAMEDAGIKPYSVKLGDKWVSYSKLHPAIAFNLALVAAIRDAEQNKKLDDTQIDTLLAGAAKWVNFFADQSYVKNIGDFVSAAKGDLSGVSRYISNYPQQLIPFRALLGWINKITDPYQRQIDPTGTQLDKTLQNIASQIPGLSQTLQPKMDEKGQPIKRQYPIINAISPYQISKENPKNALKYKFTLPPSQVYEFIHNTTDPELKRKYTAYLKKTYPVKYANVVKYAKDIKLGTTRKEENLRNLSVDQRANYIVNELKKYPKGTIERTNYLKGLREKGIITDNVLQRLKTLLSQ